MPKRESARPPAPSTDVQRREQGELPGAVVIDRTVLEWRLDPSSPNRIPEAVGYDLVVIVVSPGHNRPPSCV